MLAGHGPTTERLSRWVASPFILLRVPPNVLTVAGALLVCFPAAYAARGDYLVAGLLFGLVSMLDMVDGAVARATNRVTAFGGYLDSVVDRVADAAILIGIGMGLTGRAWWGVVGAALVGQYATSYARARVYQDGAPPATLWRQFFERPERVLLLTLTLLGQGFVTRLALPAPPAPAWVAPETAVLFWGLLLYGVLALSTAFARVLKVRVFLGAKNRGN
ncbi:MAG: CDP-alcohol phosphatidyltransferase family protein [Euryarchaeota archaeon]|nr:CDP-alcohol phosphatidyltransferase family protein [Euryarchaeota archaeon]